MAEVADMSSSDYPTDRLDRVVTDGTGSHKMRRPTVLVLRSRGLGDLLTAVLALRAGALDAAEVLAGRGTGRTVVDVQAT